MVQITNNAMLAQPKDEALAMAAEIKQSLSELEGKDLGHGLVYNGGTITPSQDDERSPYLLGEDGQPVVFHHYRNLSTVTHPDNDQFHDLMHFGTLTAAHSRAFSRRLTQSGQQFSEDLILSDTFNACAHKPIAPDSPFGEEILFSVQIEAKQPFFIPDIGQTQFFQNRAVLYATGLFEEHEIDDDLFDEQGYPQDDIDEKVLNRLRERGHDSIAYLNDIEDPNSLSVIILNKDQAKRVDFEDPGTTGIRYRFGAVGSEKVVESDAQKNVQIRSVPSGKTGLG